MKSSYAIWSGYESVPSYNGTSHNVEVTYDSDVVISFCLPNKEHFTIRCDATDAHALAREVTEVADALAEATRANA